MKARLRPALIVAFIWTLAPLGTAQAVVPAQPRAELRTVVRPSSEPLVGQRTSIYITVLMSEQPEHSPRFGLPEVDGALFRQAPGSPLLGTELLGGQSYVTQRFELLLFPQRAGTLRVPAVEVRVQLGAEVASLTTEPLEITAQLPAGVAPGTLLLTTERLVITQTWEPQLGAPGAQLEVGDALRRTITIHAANVLGVAIPPAPVPRPDGLSVYPADPVTEDKLQRGALSSSRTDVVTYVCSSPGPIELPALRYRWWNPERGVLEQRELPGVTFVVVAAPAPNPGALVASANNSGAGLSLAATSPAQRAVAAVLALGALVLFLTRKRLRRRWASLRRAREASEGASFGRLSQACRAGAPGLTWSALAAWLGHPDFGPAPLALGQSAIVRATPDLAREVALLQETLLTPGQPWSGESLLGALREARRHGLGHPGRAHRALPPLNPSAD